MANNYYAQYEVHGSKRYFIIRELYARTPITSCKYIFFAFASKFNNSLNSPNYATTDVTTDCLKLHMEWPIIMRSTYSKFLNQFSVI